jgi:hypothetical protein
MHAGRPAGPQPECATDVGAPDWMKLHEGLSAARASLAEIRKAACRLAPADGLPRLATGDPKRYAGLPTWPVRSGSALVPPPCTQLWGGAQGSRPEPYLLTSGLSPRRFATSTGPLQTPASRPPGTLALQKLQAPGRDSLRAFRSGAVARLTLNVRPILRYTRFPVEGLIHRSRVGISLLLPGSILPTDWWQGLQPTLPPAV